MGQRWRLSLFLGVFLLLNLAFVPLLAAYGLSVCPVLRVVGFRLGCAYSGLFVTIVYALNLPVIFWQLRRKSSRFAALLYPAGYLVATGLALFFLQSNWDISHAGAQSRAPQILLLASALLGITQFYGLTWIKREGAVVGHASINQLWRRHGLRVMLPILAAATVLAHFAASLKDLGDGSFVTVSSAAGDTLLVILFVIAWLAVTYLFHFLAEKDAVVGLGRQIQAVEAGNYPEARSFVTWGLWHFLSQRLEAMGQTMKERNLLVKSFSRFVARDIVSRATTQEIEAAEGEKVELTIIMTDIRGFTRIADTLAPEKIIRMLNTYFDMVIEVFVRHDIHIDKFIGDGILAYVDPCGDARGDNDRALRALQEILARLVELNRQLAGEGLPAIEIGGGVHRGEVVRGLIGSNRRLEHTIIGDPVNRAARLESLTKEFGVSLVISDAVFNDASPGERQAFRPLGQAHVKGIQQALSVFGR